MRRNFGLDIYRSIAILMVLACHSFGFFYNGWFNATPLIWALGLGVEVFFALSGFLIGGILIRDIVEQPQPVSAPRRLFAFYIRRWLRTLPLYYLLVIVSLYYTQWPHFSLTSVSIDHTTLIANLLFIQNFRQKWLAFQPVTWSLTIEEWFYLLVALGMLAISLVKQRRLRAQLVLLFGLAVILASLSYRISDFLVNHNNWDIGMRQQIFMHMDALMFGVLAAWLSHYYPDLYARLAHSRRFGALAAAMVIFIGYRYVYSPLLDPTINDSLLAPTLCISALGVGFAALVMVFQAQFTVTSATPTWVVGVFRHLSTRSYGYYLIHWPIFVLLQRALTPGSLAQHVAINIVALALTFPIANVVHVYYERPFMRLRDKIRLIPMASMASMAPALRPALIRLLNPAEIREAASLTVTQPRFRAVSQRDVTQHADMNAGVGLVD